MLVTIILATGTAFKHETLTTTELNRLVHPGELGSPRELLPPAPSYLAPTPVDRSYDARPPQRPWDEPPQRSVPRTAPTVRVPILVPNWVVDDPDPPCDHAGIPCGNHNWEDFNTKKKSQLCCVLQIRICAGANIETFATCLYLAYSNGPCAGMAPIQDWPLRVKQYAGLHFLFPLDPYQVPAYPTPVPPEYIANSCDVPALYLHTGVNPSE